MEFEFFKSKTPERGAKLTVHKNGKAGFSASADELMKLSEWSWCAFAKDKSSTTDKHIYMIKMSEPSDVTFNIAKAGNYYYVKITSLLDDLGIDYNDDYKRTIFDITPIQNGEQTIYKLTRRDIKKRNKKAE